MLIFVANNGIEIVEFGKSGIYVVGLDADENFGLNSDGIVFVAEVDVSHLYVAFLHNAIHETHHEFVGTSAFEMNVGTRVAALEVLEKNVDKLISVGHRRRSEGKHSVSAHAAGATHTNFAIFLAIEVEQNVAVDHALAKVVGAGHSHFFVDGE